MPLTAYDPDTGRIILPGATAASPQCRDPKCRANLSQVRPSERAVGHFRHTVHTDCPSVDPVREREAMSPWHMWWQSQCDDPERIEYTHTTDSGDRRRADIYTRWRWCIEVQHSPIAPKVIRSRQDHWNGRVLWLLNAASPDRQIDLSVDDLTLVVDGAWVSHITTQVAVDDGEFVWILPERWGRSHGQLAVATNRLRCVTRQEFVDQWINADSSPYQATPRSQWAIDTYRKEAERNGADQQQRQADAARRMLHESLIGYDCEYTGVNAERLVKADETGAAVTVCTRCHSTFGINAGQLLCLNCERDLWRKRYSNDNEEVDA
jgi:hypothetical protein